MKGDVFKVATNVLAAEIEEGKLFEFIKDAEIAGYYNKDRPVALSSNMIYSGSINWATKYDYDGEKGVLIDVHEYAHYYSINPSGKYWSDKGHKPEPLPKSAKASSVVTTALLPEAETTKPVRKRRTPKAE